ncbi:MAG: alanine--tRNA ligase [Ruminococcaceae bacterium]|nr:alanine--tRNA ligase [Oscillospiraceae bacterium]
MRWTGLNELRESYLSFFESKGHLRLPSFSLVPKDDKSLLLINAGMAPMKKYFTGEVTPPRKRVTTCQKCIRTPDIERVGITARHGTYFEMLGNFSFGDYFKREATAWSWEYLTKVLEIPEERLYVSIYLEDDEAFDIWTKEVGVDPSHVVRFGKEDNFWEHGAGPCGPCSEIYFDRGEKYGCGKPDCKVGCDCDRYIEVWNNVFTQFDSDGKGTYTPLSNPNIDTGMGLERLACVMQDVDNLFLVDTVQNIMKKICAITGVDYGKDEKSDISLRVITDHIRSTTFMIGDGVMPSNTGRGYVLRRLLRRAARHGRLLGVDKPFLTEVCDTVIEENKSAYPELEEKRDFIKKIISVEEDNFAKTVDQGMQILDKFIAENPGGTLSGEAAFRLQDTFGFPIDLTVEILADKGASVDTEAFRKIYDENRAFSRKQRKNAGAEAWEGEADPTDGLDATVFEGYTVDVVDDAKVAAIIAGGALVDTAAEGDEVVIVLDKTPFYGESGGQIGDTGVITSDTAELNVVATNKNHAGIFLHNAVVSSGEIKVGDTVKAAIDSARRMSIRRNHTAAHLLQAALRNVLGTHVEQKGQMVDENVVRFDFAHFAAMTSEEIRKVEDMVNDVILSGIKVTSKEMPIAKAKKMGAMALFGEKYGDVVRVVKAGDFSVELCGGTHIDNAAKLGLFKIKSESSVAAGVRRIEAVTGANVLALIRDNEATIEETCAAMKLGNSADIVKRSTQLMSELKEKDRQIEQLGSKLAGIQIDSLMNSAKDIGGVKLVVNKFGAVSADELRTMGDKVKDKDSCAVAVFAAVNGEKATLFVCAGKDAVAKGANAGQIVKAVAQLTGGNGGGKPDAAMAGAKDISKIDSALSAAEGIVSGMLK